ncbi:hypothetical protein CIPAW_01G151700 [Carya illinoinensis]|uniref:Uncharacterized protein n=1 Tax=Carya illinoinensis TaxID=32201 RepID=A0A8T1RPI1_CARIL|nr:hypothetical protein CIPAW_01G151700 [Carya illinoinensis]
MKCHDSVSRAHEYTAGTEGLHPSRVRAHSISFPLESSASSKIAWLTPCSYNSLVIAWHMQHELLLKITTGFSDAILTMRSIDIIDGPANSQLKKVFSLSL